VAEEATTAVAGAEIMQVGTTKPYALPRTWKSKEAKSYLRKLDYCGYGEGYFLFFQVRELFMALEKRVWAA
jgi:hypothetical protein